jgi:CRP/FNR family transcriptional regulator
VIDIYKADDVFGESAFLNAHNRAEQASTLESTKLMIWSLATVQEIVVRRPRLAIALLQILVQRTISFKERIQSFSLETIACRLAHALLRFSERLGTRDESGAVRMVPFTHELLSQYVGTSREIVTHYMNEFRRQGCLNYSRRAIVLYPAVFGNWLSQNS